MVLLLLYSNVPGVVLVNINRQVQSHSLAKVAYGISDAVSTVNKQAYHQEILIESALMAGRDEAAVEHFLAYVQEFQLDRVSTSSVLHRCMVIALESDLDSFYKLFTLLKGDWAYYRDFVEDWDELSPEKRNSIRSHIERIVAEEAEQIDLDIKPVAANEKLKNIINNLYKGQSNPNRIGNGTTMDAIRSELATGKPTGGKYHSQKGQESIQGLRNLLDKGVLSAEDAYIAQKLIEDLTNALAGR